MNILDLLNTVTTVKKNKIAQLSVRELDEEPKGTFIAFVDDKADSFDVSVLLQKGELLHHSCDCGSKDAICLHKLAVLFRISNQENGVKAKTPRVKKAVKLSEAQLILQDLSLQALTSWLHSFLGHNKEAENQFLHHFSKQSTSFELSDMEPLVSKSFVSVMVKRKKIELNELKKIIQFLEQSLASVFNYLQTIITEGKAYAILEEIIASLDKKFYSYAVPGTRLQKYIAQLIDRFTLMLNNVQDDEVWQASLNRLLHKLFDKDFGKVHFLLIQCIYDLNKNGSTEQKEFMSNWIAEKLQFLEVEEYRYSKVINQQLLEILIENKKLRACYSYFTPIPYENEFNILYLNALKDIDAEATVNYCFGLIAQNSKVDYNVPYLKIAEEILERANGNKSLLAKVKHDLFPFEPKFENYLFVVNHLENKATITKFRNNTLARLRNLFYQNESNKILYLQILNSEDNTTKMLDVIKQTPMSYAVLKPYMDTLATINKDIFMSSICKDIIENLSDGIAIPNKDEICNFAHKQYTQMELQDFLAHLWNQYCRFYPTKTHTRFFEFFEENA